MKKLVVAASIRNIKNTVKPVFDNINRLTNLFDEVVCILIESDSNDNTLQLLKEYKNYLKCKLIVYSLGSLMHSIPNRMERICKARNFYLNIIKTSYIEWDYLLIIDFNDTNIEPYNIESFKSNFELDLDWNMICANQAKTYYDLYALRHPIWMPFNCWNAIGKRPSFISYEAAHNMYVKSRFLHIPTNHPPILVDSAFGGSAFIKINKIKDSIHEAVDKYGEEECEWVSFCKNIGKVYINPKFVNMQKENRHVILANSI